MGGGAFGSGWPGVGCGRWSGRGGVLLEEVKRSKPSWLVAPLPPALARSAFKRGPETVEATKTVSRTHEVKRQKTQTEEEVSDNSPTTKPSSPPCRPPPRRHRAASSAPSSRACATRSRRRASPASRAAGACASSSRGRRRPCRWGRGSAPPSARTSRGLW